MEVGTFRMELECRSVELVIIIKFVYTAQRVDLRRTIATSPSGIYRCYIATVAVHDDSDLSVKETVYIGIYGLGGQVVSLFAINYIALVVHFITYVQEISQFIDTFSSLFMTVTIHTVLFLHWWTCYHYHLDQKLHHRN